MNKIDTTKRYQTRDGRSVKLYATDCHPMYPIHGAISDRSGSWTPASWTEDGGHTACSIGPCDLMPIKQWRAWRKNDAKPKFIITKDQSKLRLEAHCFFQSDCDAELQMLFDHSSWIHEDGSETPCGVLE